MADQDTALEAMAREELGIDPDELGGSAWTAAIASFLLFTVGALIPVVPFVFAEGDAAVVSASPSAASRCSGLVLQSRFSLVAASGALPFASWQSASAPQV